MTEETNVLFARADAAISEAKRLRDMIVSAHTLLAAQIGVRQLKRFNASDRKTRYPQDFSEYLSRPNVKRDD